MQRTTQFHLDDTQLLGESAPSNAHDVSTTADVDDSIDSTAAYTQEVDAPYSRFGTTSHTDQYDHFIPTEFNVRRYHPTVKRILDLSLLAASSPVLRSLLFATALLIKLSSRGPIFCIQRRTSLDGR